ncbi:MAG TPA: rod shape-determining protein MreD [Frankiaceae bacterium]|nr:rod shape-determining protein MreD [Frankiaceae bacterium]
MTLIAPGDRRTPPQSRRPIPPRTGQDTPLIGLALAPPAGEALETRVLPTRLSGSARLGAALLLVIGLLLQRTVLPLVPWGPADLVTVLVAVLGLYAGPVAGCLSGFGIGLASDALSDHALGRLAAVLCLVGYVCGMVPAARANRFPIAWVSIGVACVITPLLFAITGAFVGDDRAAGTLLATRCLAGLVYGLLLAPIAYPLTRRLLGERSRRKRRTRRIAQ